MAPKNLRHPTLEERLEERQFAQMTLSPQTGQMAAEESGLQLTRDNTSLALLQRHSQRHSPAMTRRAQPTGPVVFDLPVHLAFDLQVAADKRKKEEVSRLEESVAVPACDPPGRTDSMNLGVCSTAGLMQIRA